MCFRVRTDSIRTAMQTAKGQVTADKHYPEAAVKAVREAVNLWDWLPIEGRTFGNVVHIVVKFLALYGDPPQADMSKLCELFHAC